MRIMIDTNVLISAFVFGGKTGKLLDYLLNSEHKLLVSDYVDKEFKDKLDIKWHNKAEKVYELYHTLSFEFCESTDKIDAYLRDVKDIPILCDAIFYHVDVILTGDNDFLEAELEKPLVFSPSMMWEYLRIED